MLQFLIGCIRRFVVTTIITILVLMFAPGLPPHDAKFEDVPLKPSVPFTGGLAVNQRLNKAELVTDNIEGSNLGFIKVNDSITCPLESR